MRDDDLLCRMYKQVKCGRNVIKFLFKYNSIKPQAKPSGYYRKASIFFHLRNLE